LPNCWAAELGGCSREQSGEHVFSKSLFSQDELNLEGVPWLKGKQRKLPKLALTAAILCKRHNETLSELDAEAGALSSAFRRLFEQPGQHTHTLKGLLYERWLMKSMINVVASGWAPKGKILPPLELVEVAFGIRTLNGSAGLYVVEEVTDVDQGIDLLRWEVLTDAATQREIFGLYTYLRGFLTFLTIPQGDPGPLVRGIGKTAHHDFRNATLRHRPRTLSCDATDRNSNLQLKIEW
jgi:hypothetical protein